MKRLCVVAACLTLAAPAWAQKLRVEPHVPLAPPVVQAINGTPLTVFIGDDTGMQVLNSNIPGGSGQFFPGGCTNSVADGGVFVRIAGVNYGPNFNEHSCGSAAIQPTPWTPVSITPVTGTGTSGNPFTVVVVVDAGATGLRMTETLTYVNGATTTNTTFVFQNTNAAGGQIAFDVFFGADLYLADSDSGIPFLAAGNAPGGHDCAAQTYSIYFLTTTPNDRYGAEHWSTVWSEIAAGMLSNSVDAVCQDNGAANQWQNRTVDPGASTTIASGVAFTGFVGPPPVQAVVPALTTLGIAAFVGLLALVGYVLARKSSLGA
jgi:hypothetical protein